MRIEKISDQQIRCILNKQDLKERELRISELAYGTEKAKALFRDMMQQASYEFGFEAEDIPLMIEAIPMLPDTLILVITKVEEPDELDTRFSHFSSDSEEGFEEEEDFSSEFESDLAFPEPAFADLADISPFVPEEIPSQSGDTLDTLDKNLDNRKKTAKEDDFISLSEALGMEPRPKEKPAPQHPGAVDITRCFRFQNLQQICMLGESLLYIYHGKNTVYKDTVKEEYYLVVHKSDHTPEEFNRICNAISEYGLSLRNMYANNAFYEEHFQVIVKDKALQVLGDL